jgi:hypothetical protein
VPFFLRHSTTVSIVSSFALLCAMAYGVHRITKHYEMFCGTGRAEGLVTLHPEYRLGKVGSECGLDGRKTKWVLRNKEHFKPAHSAVGAKLRANSLHATARLTQSASSPSVSRTNGGSARKAQASPVLDEDGKLPSLRACCTLKGAKNMGSGDDLDKFLMAVTAPTQLQHFTQEHLPSGSMVAKHYQDKRERLAQIRDHFQRDPEGARSMLSQNDTWKFYAAALREVDSKRVWLDDPSSTAVLQATTGAPVKTVGRFKYVMPNNNLGLAPLSPEPPAPKAAGPRIIGGYFELT